MCLCSAVLMSGGNLLEKRSVDGMSEFSIRHARQMIGSLLRSSTWIAGSSCSVAAVVLQVLALTVTPIVVAQSIYVGGLVLLTFASRRWMGEAISRTEIAGVGVIVCALVLVALSLGGRTPTHLSASDFAVLLLDCLTAAIACMLYCILSRRSLNFVMYGIISGLLYGIAGVAGAGMSSLVQRFGVEPSLTHIATSPFPYLLCLASVPALFFYQKGIQIGRIAIMAPIQGALSSVYIVIAGTIVFGQSLPATAWVGAFRMIGFCGVILGIVIIARHRPLEAA